MTDNYTNALESLSRALREVDRLTAEVRAAKARAEALEKREAEYRFALLQKIAEADALTAALRKVRGAVDGSGDLAHQAARLVIDAALSAPEASHG